MAGVTPTSVVSSAAVALAARPAESLSPNDTSALLDSVALAVLALQV